MMQKQNFTNNKFLLQRIHFCFSFNTFTMQLMQTKTNLDVEKVMVKLYGTSYEKQENDVVTQNGHFSSDTAESANSTSNKTECAAKQQHV
jgi:hypothetical protein